MLSDNKMGISFRAAVKIFIILIFLFSETAISVTLQPEDSAKLSKSLADKIQKASSDIQIPVIIVLSNKDVREDEKARNKEAVLSALHSANINEKYNYKFINAISANINSNMITDLAKSPGVEKIWEDRIYSLPPAYPTDNEMKLENGNDIIGAKYIWNTSGFSGKGITVAVIDSGIDYKHPDLGGCIGEGCRIKAGYDFVDNDPDPIDENGHGTHVAGIIGANGTIKGVAPDIEFLAARVCSINGCPLSAIIAGMDWAAYKGADIISMSLGGTSFPNDEYESPDSIIADAIVERGIVVVVAAGNEGPATGTISSPGAGKKVITVGAANNKNTIKLTDDYVAYFSNRGPSAFGRLDPDIVAPGVAINSTWLNNTYISLQGTSMATPFVSGSAALLLQSDPGLKPDDVRSKLMSSGMSLKKIQYRSGKNYTGIWGGPNVELNVTDSIVTTFNISYRVYGGSACPYYATTTYSNIPIIDNKINYTDSNSQLDGTFSLYYANGTFNDTFYVYSPEYTACYSGPVKWKAKPRSYVKQYSMSSVFEQGAGLLNIRNAITNTTRATINNNDRWETTVEPGSSVSSRLKITNNNKINSIKYYFSFEFLEDAKMNKISSSGFKSLDDVVIAAGSNETLKIEFSAPLDAEPSIYGTTLVIRGDNSEVLRIPIVITIPLTGDGIIKGTVNEDSTGGSGDWIYYKIKSYNGTTLKANLEWAGDYDDLDLYLFAPNGEIIDASEQRTGKSENVELADMIYDEYWLAVHAQQLETYEDKPFSINVNYASGLEVFPPSWKGEIEKGGTKDITFTLKNDANVKPDLNLRVKRLVKGGNKYYTGSMEGGLKTIWNSSDTAENQNISYLRASLRWNDSNKDIDMFLAYPSPFPFWIMAPGFQEIDTGSDSIPTFGDLDNDGDLDLIVGKFDGSLSYYENIGSKSFPIWKKDSDMLSDIDVWLKSAPRLVDLDNDGDLDLTIGNNDGKLDYYKNTGSSSSPRWKKIESMFSGIDVGYGSIPEFADLDNDGDLDLVIGSYNNNLSYYENTGSASSPVWTEKKSLFKNIDVGTYSAPSFVDLDNDGDLDLVTGNNEGLVKFYKNSSTKAWYSGKGNNVENHLQRSFDLSKVSGATLYFRTWFEIEPAFDKGNVQVSTDRGSTWVTLKEYSGSSGPINESINLSAYAGRHDLLLRFNYSTDESLTMNGWYIDDISIPQIGFVDNAEDGINEWNTSGWFIDDIKWIYDPSMFKMIKTDSNSAPVFFDLDNDGDMDMIIGSYSGNLQYYINSNLALTRFGSMHNNSMLGAGNEKIGNADIKYYIRKYGNIGIVLYSDDPSSKEYNLSVNLGTLVPWKAASIDQNNIYIDKNEEKQITVSIDSSSLKSGEIYESVLTIANSTEEFARVNMKLAVGT